jgi:hypothetical protein
VEPSGRSLDHWMILLKGVGGPWLPSAPFFWLPGSPGTNGEPFCSHTHSYHDVLPHPKQWSQVITKLLKHEPKQTIFLCKLILSESPSLPSFLLSSFPFFLPYFLSFFLLYFPGTFFPIPSLFLPSFLLVLIPNS